MATGSDILSAVNSNQAANVTNYLSKLLAKESSTSSPEASRPQGSDTVSFSEEAKRLYADRSKNDTEVIQGLIDKAMEMVRDKYTPSTEVEKTYGAYGTYGLDALNNRVGDSKTRLNDLMDKMRGALMDGDRHGAAATEKEIVQFFRNLEPVKPGASGATNSNSK